MREEEGNERKLVRASTAGEIKTGPFLGGRGGVSFTKGRGSDGRRRAETAATDRSLSPASVANVVKRTSESCTVTVIIEGDVTIYKG